MEQYIVSSHPRCDDSILSSSNVHCQPIPLELAAAQPRNVSVESHPLHLLPDKNFKTAFSVEQMLSKKITALAPQLNLSGIRPLDTAGDDAHGLFQPEDKERDNNTALYQPYPNLQLLPACVAPLSFLRSPPSREEWDQNKPTIKRLYLDEDNALHIVKNTMSRDFDFHAR